MLPGNQEDPAGQLADFLHRHDTARWRHIGSTKGANQQEDGSSQRHEGFVLRFDPNSTVIKITQRFWGDTAPGMAVKEESGSGNFK